VFWMCWRIVLMAFSGDTGSSGDKGQRQRFTLTCMKGKQDKLVKLSFRTPNTSED
jgi:hypothetical protein